MNTGDKIVKVNTGNYFDLIEEDGELFVSIKDLVNNLSKARAITGEENPVIHLNNLIKYLEGIHLI